MATRDLCTFQVGDLLLGVDVLKVQEVLRHQEITPVPLAPPEVRGLIHLRGRILTAIDLRRRFGLAPLAGGLAMNVVLQSVESGVALLADSIGDVLHVEPSSIDDPPSSLDPHIRGLITGVCRLEGRLLLLLDTEKAIEIHAG